MPRTIGEELLIPAIAEVVETVLLQHARDVTNKIPLGNDTVQRRINAMAKDIEDALCCMLRKSECCPVTKQLRPLYKRRTLRRRIIVFEGTHNRYERCLFFKQCRNSLWKKEFPSEHNAVATDGAPAILGCQRGFISYLKKIVRNMPSIHCVLHRQHLVARRLSPRLNESLQYVINAVNKIKSNPLNDRLFRRLYGEYNDELNRLLQHTEVR
ncbi:hypothetical protein M514_00890 [Trichuris suis]|uniref:SCAN domain-containing protein 3 n=1 Tax=Trichuris suis TaxID=68888 RepID=A0A085MYW3_9BILA|nr:hypothetical protein M513_00890 [Trichuris suis]KFD62409.1 hypothetical protein M514_00890 [Trichuris suis]